MTDHKIELFFCNFTKDINYKNRFIKLNFYFANNNKPKWYSNLDELKIYIDENNKRPRKSDLDEKIKLLGHWVGNQITHAKSRKQIMKDQEIYDTWQQFVKEYNIYFPNT